MTAIGTPDPSVTGATLAQQIQRGYALLQAARWDEAVEHAQRLARRHPNDRQVLDYAAEATLAQGDMAGALRWIDRLIGAGRGNPAFKIKKARLLMKMRRRAELVGLLEEVAAEAGNDGRLHWELGRVHYANNRQAEAISHYEKASRLLGEHPGLLYDLAVSRFFSGDFEQAERELDRALVLAPRAGHALYLRATLRRQTSERNHVADIERRLQAGFGDPALEASALYALAKELEDLGEHEKSFAALLAGARKKRSTYEYDVAAECETLQAVCAAYTAEVMRASSPGHDEEGPIFIVGMPRTGTTLLERMLVQSGRVRAAGELLDFGNLLGAAAQLRVLSAPELSLAAASRLIDFAALGREYLRGAREAADGSRRFIDKLPVNYMYCGIIKKALPKAKILHVVRDPLDSCYAVFKTQFFSAYSFSYDLEELADYYIGYHRMMRHWHEVMPGEILDVRYEELVSDTENQVRRVFDWCGIEWDPRVLEPPADKSVVATASAAQVREPVHGRSVGSSRRHRQGLAPLIAKLEAAGIVVD